MLPLLRLLLRLRPALWLLGLVLLAMALSPTWERSTSYDDGGLGSASFAILFTFGQPFLISLHLAGALTPLLGDWWQYVAWPIGLGGGLACYLWLDRVTQRWLKQLSTISD